MHVVYIVTIYKERFEGENFYAFYNQNRNVTIKT